MHTEIERKRLRTSYSDGVNIQSKILVLMLYRVVSCFHTGTVPQQRSGVGRLSELWIPNSSNAPTACLVVPHKKVSKRLHS